MSSPLSQGQIDGIISLFGRLPVQEIAESCETSVATVYRIAKEHNLLNPREELDHDKQAYVIEHFMAGDKVSAICKALGVNAVDVYKVINEAGVTRNVTKNTNKKDAAVQMYIEGELIKDILRECGISYSTLNEELHARGVPFRRK
jgi:transposase-like protein